MKIIEISPKVLAMNSHIELEKELLELKQLLLELKQYIMDWQVNNKRNPNYDELELMCNTAQYHIHAKQNRVSVLRKICDM